MTGVHKLSNEIWKDILDHIESDPQVSVAIDRRNHLSVESFRIPSPPLPSQAHDIGSFRRTCRRFSELGASYQFARVSLRFSLSGFRRLDDISSTGRLARHTKKFSYLVPPFYGNSEPIGSCNKKSILMGWLRGPARRRCKIPRERRLRSDFAQSEGAEEDLAIRRRCSDT